ncbi:TPA: hypothetical protein ACH3X2_011832 [Trebouxia sp. C0005]
MAWLRQLLSEQPQLEQLQPELPVQRLFEQQTEQQLFEPQPVQQLGLPVHQLFDQQRPEQQLFGQPHMQQPGSEQQEWLQHCGQDLPVRSEARPFCLHAELLLLIADAAEGHAPAQKGLQDLQIHPAVCNIMASCECFTAYFVLQLLLNETSLLSQP